MEEDAPLNRELGPAEPGDPTALPAGRADAASSFRDDAHAVIIGINVYADRRIRQLQFAAADAQALYDVLTDPTVGRFRPENVALLLNEQATERRIRSEIATRLPRRTGRDSTVCVYYAGHGAPLTDQSGKAQDGMEKYLIPHDADVDDLRATGISMDSVQEYFGYLDARQLVFLLDCCYAGGAGGEEGRSFDVPGFRTRATLSDAFLQNLATEGRFVVTACGVNEVSIETPEHGHGLFTYYLLNGLKGAADRDGDGLVTLEELYRYLYQNVERESRRLGGNMRPLKHGSVSGEIYLTQYATDPARRARALSSAATRAFNAGDFAAARAQWEEVLALVPGDEQATIGIAASGQRHAEEMEKVRTAGAQRQQVLLTHRRSGAIPVELYARAVESLESNPDTLTAGQREFRDLVEALTDGRITAPQFLQSVAVTTGERVAMPRPLMEPPAPSAGPSPATGAPRPVDVAERTAPAATSRPGMWWKMGAGVAAVVIITVAVERWLARDDILAHSSPAAETPPVADSAVAVTHDEPTSVPTSQRRDDTPPPRSETSPGPERPGGTQRGVATPGPVVGLTQTAAWARSLSGGRQVEVSFVNGFPTPVDLWWVDFDGVEQSYGRLEPLKPLVATSYARHLWLFRDVATGALRSVARLGTGQAAITSPNGHTVGHVQYAALGTTNIAGDFVQKSPTEWEETHASDASPFHFRETNRDDWSVYLRDDSRGMSIQLDLWRRQVLVDQGSGMRPLYSVAMSRVSGWSASVISYGTVGGHLQGQYERSGNGWVHTKSDGSTERLTEVMRDDWSVYLRATNGSEVALDVHRLVVVRRSDGATLATILVAS